MESKTGSKLSAIIDEIQNNGTGYNFYQLVFMLEKIIGILKVIDPGDEYKIIFYPSAYYTYPATDIHNIAFNKESKTFIITVNFLGLYGIDSPLPRCYHEQIYQQTAYKSDNEIPLKDFLNIFNNRFYELFYQAWKKYKYHLFFDKQDSYNSGVNQSGSSFLNKLFLLSGIWQDEKELSDVGIEKRELLRLSGILHQKVRNRQGLLCVLQEFFPQYEISINENVPEQVYIENRPALKEKNFILSANSIIGDKVFDYSNRICLVVGPLTFNDYLDFLPGGLNNRKVKTLLEMYLPDNMHYDLKLKVKTSTIAQNGYQQSKLKLGRSFWLGKPQTEYEYIYLNNERFQEVYN